MEYADIATHLKLEPSTACTIVKRAEVRDSLGSWVKN
jgi:hypothetical protein